MSRDDLIQALYCRKSTHFGIDCNHCPYGRKVKARYVCDVAKICHDTLEVMKADASEINHLAKLSNEYKVRLMAMGGDGQVIYIGVDPGQKGGYSYIMDGMPKAFPWDDTFFVHDMRCLASIKCETLVAAVEKVGARPGQGTVSMFNFGKSAGYIEGVLTALGIPYQLVPPAKWKKEFSLIGKDKQASIMTCHRLFPDLVLRRTEKCRTDSDGLAESTLLAEYARRKF